MIVWIGCKVHLQVSLELTEEASDACRVDWKFSDPHQCTGCWGPQCSQPLSLQETGPAPLHHGGLRGAFSEDNSGSHKARCKLGPEFPHCHFRHIHISNASLKIPRRREIDPLLAMENCREFVAVLNSFLHRENNVFVKSCFVVVGGTSVYIADPQGSYFQSFTN